MMKNRILEWLNTALMFNLFFVLFGFFWLAIAVVGRSFHLSLGLDLWYQLWQPVFNPAIGILMLGAIASGIASWVNRKLNDRQASN